MFGSGSLHLFAFFQPGGSMRIGQCAVRMHRGSVRFLDSLLIDPEHKALAADCMDSLLNELNVGSAVISHGSPWNIHPPITSTLAQIPKVELLNEKRYRVDAIDLREHGDAETLLRALNASHRRNIKKGKSSDPLIKQYAGAKCLLHLRSILALHRETYQRKGLKHRWLANAASLATKAVAFGERATLSFVERQRRQYAGVFGLEHDSMFFFLRGGSVPNNMGLSHLQHWSMIDDCFRREIDYYVMGYAYEEDLGSPQLESQRMFKQRFRTKEFPGSIVQFRRVA
jgi:hypothetical protein